MLPAPHNATSSPQKHSSKKKSRRKEVRPTNFQAPHWAGWAIVIAFGIAIFSSLILWVHNTSKNQDEGNGISYIESANQGSGQLVMYPGRGINYGSKFNDTNQTHIDVAKVVGLPSPLQLNSDVKKHKSKLTRISSTHNYKVDDLTHSLPYLTKNAAKELDAIAADFADILERNGLPHYRFIVTSVLRTEESVTALQKSGNINSTTNSAHCYGTTFDITYTRFDKKDRTSDYMTEDNLKLVLGQALLNEQRAGHIYVKYEVKQACFHITSRL